MWWLVIADGWRNRCTVCCRFQVSAVTTVKGSSHWRGMTILLRTRNAHWFSGSSSLPVPCTILATRKVLHGAHCVHICVITVVPMRTMPKWFWLKKRFRMVSLAQFGGCWRISGPFLSGNCRRSPKGWNVGSLPWIQRIAEWDGTTAGTLNPWRSTD